MSRRGYGQYCGIARALELVGERWALLVVRDLILGPKRFGDLRRGLPRIPSNVLSARLKELERDGIVRRRLLPQPERGIVYELTEYGRELEDIVIRLGLWGVKALGEQGPDEIVNADSLQLALRSMFDPDAARDLQARFEVRVGETVVNARVDHGALDVGEGALAEADLVLETEQPLNPLLSGELEPREAIESGRVRIKGTCESLERFVEIFHVTSARYALPPA